MNRAVILAVATAATATLSLDAHAAPPGQSRAAWTSFEIASAHGHYVDVSLRLVDGGVMRLSTQACDAQQCDAPDSWTGPVTGSSVSGSTDDATLRTTLDGHALKITWTRTGQPGFSGETGDASSGPNGESVSSAYGDDTKVRITLDGATCATDGGVGSEVHLSDSDSADGAPLSELELPAGALHC